MVLQLFALRLPEEDPTQDVSFYMSVYSADIMDAMLIGRNSKAGWVLSTRNSEPKSRDIDWSGTL